MKLQCYHYETPDNIDDQPKAHVRFCRSEILSASVQIVRDGGETNMHAHHGADAIWYVIGGEAAFYDEDNERVVLKKNDSVVIPSDTKYWFESCGSEPLEILHVVASDPRVAPARLDVTERPKRYGQDLETQASELASTSA